MKNLSIDKKIYRKFTNPNLSIKEFTNNALYKKILQKFTINKNFLKNFP